MTQRWDRPEARRPSLRTRTGRLDACCTPMWCKQCRQDVPGVPSKGGRLRCLRCGKLVCGDAMEQGATHVSKGVAAMADCGLELNAPAASAERPAMDFDDWDLDPDLRSLRSARTAAAADTVPPQMHPQAAYRIDPAHAQMSWPPSHVFQNMHDAGFMSSPQPAPVERAEVARRASLMAWTVMSLGLMAFCCGGVLLGWSFLAKRTDLWNLGVPVTVIGQIALLVGLVLQLERIWQNNRYAVDKLEEVDERLADIRHSQSLLRVNHGSAAQAFYSHMAEGASPSLLLADLKGQLDLLAVRLSERPR